VSDPRERPFADDQADDAKPFAAEANVADRAEPPTRNVDDLRGEQLTRRITAPGNGPTTFRASQRSSPATSGRSSKRTLSRTKGSSSATNAGSIRDGPVPAERARNRATSSDGASTTSRGT